MPEGPEIRRAADQLARAVEGEIAERVEFHWPPLAGAARRVQGQRIVRVAPRGKAMLITFANGLTLYSHNQLYGVWRVAKAGTRPRSTRALRVAIDGPDRAVLLYSASDIELLLDADLPRHPYIARLGPDLLDPALDAATIAERLRDRRFRGRALSALLLDQGFVAGIGNYLRSEMLYVAGLLPTHRPGRLDDAAIAALAEAIIDVGRQAYRLAGVTNNAQRAARLKLEGLDYESRRFHVFGRDGLPCWTCGETIARSDAGSRRIYVCPGCQQ